MLTKVLNFRFSFSICLSTLAVFAGNDPFLTKNITQNRKRFITQPKDMIV